MVRYLNRTKISSPWIGSGNLAMTWFVAWAKRVIAGIYSPLKLVLLPLRSVSIGMQKLGFYQKNIFFTEELRFESSIRERAPPMG